MFWRNREADCGPADDVSIEVLNFERNLLEKQIETYQKRLSTNQLMELMEKSEYLNQTIISIRDKLKAGGLDEFSGNKTNEG